MDVYDQLDKIPIELNTENSDIFLSIGGNDIINNYNYLTNDLHKHNHLNKLFSNYSELVKSIQIKMNKANIVLLDIYYPKSSYYRSYIPIIEEWNNKLYEKEDNFKILRISKYLNDSTDFIYSIEPSKKGGEKIADMIINE
jgi:lysophospholipase L1-like esterase